MRLRLRPVDPGFFDLFSAAARHLVVGAGLLAEMLAEGTDREEVATRMRAAEREADEIRHTLLRRVNKTFVTPFDREDILALGTALDDVMDLMDEAVDMVLVYRPKRLPAELGEQVDVLQVDVLALCAELTVEMTPRLRGLHNLEDYWIQVNSLENTGDKNHRRILALLFSGEFKNLEILKLKDIAGTLESAIDGFERVADVVAQIAVKDG